jgi:hypothetical protein
MSTKLTEETFPLLEERLIVNFTRRKTGEIVVRKEIETHILHMQVPVQREKLIVEQVEPYYKRLAEIALSQEPAQARVDDQDINRNLMSSASLVEQSPIAASPEAALTIYRKFDSLAAASRLLDELAKSMANDCEQVCLEIKLKDPNH